MAGVPCCHRFMPTPRLRHRLPFKGQRLHQCQLSDAKIGTARVVEGSMPVPQSDEFDATFLTLKNASSPTASGCAVPRSSRLRSATSGHAIDQEVSMPMTGFKVQPPLGNSRLKAPVLQRGPSRSCRHDRSPMQAVRQQLDQLDWRCRPVADQQDLTSPSPKPPFQGSVSLTGTEPARMLEPSWTGCAFIGLSCLSYTLHIER